MAWKVKRIQEGDYGCEERSDEERNLVLVTLENDAGLTRQLTADDDWLYAMGIDEGGIWPEEPSAFLSFKTAKAPTRIRTTDIPSSNAAQRATRTS